MSTRSHITTLSAEWRCDATGCPAAIKAEFDQTENVSEFEAGDVIAAAALKDGWTRWTGSRTPRHYCAVHGPKPGHKMEDNSEKYLRGLIEDRERKRLFGKPLIYAEIERIPPRPE